MITKQIHSSYKKYASMIIAKCNNFAPSQLQIIVNPEIVTTLRGHATIDKNGNKKITIPTWAINKGFEFFTYYIIHEYTHHYVGFSCGHNEAFKIHEGKLVKALINCKINYKKAYPKNLVCLKNNKVVYEYGR